MTAAAGCGLGVCLLVQEPMYMGYASKLGFVPGEMGLDPSDPGDFVELRQNAAPKIPMLKTCDRSPLEGAMQGVGDISTVC